MRIDKKKIIIFGTLLFMIVAFAAVTTSLLLNGNLAIRTNNEDFNNNVVFTKANTENGESIISEDGKVIDYKSNTLKNLGQIEKLDFTVTNKSRQYDAEATINCVYITNEDKISKYINLEITPTEFALKASESQDGILSLELIRSFIGDELEVELKCTINAEAIERDNLSDPYVEPIVKENYLMAKVNNDKIWKHATNIKTITFENNLSPKEDAAFIYDLSADQDESIMAYLVANETDSNKYDTYIQADGKIMAPENSYQLFNNFQNMESINNMEYFDTSNVTNMSYMFLNCPKLQSLDLSHFNTSKVTNMGWMFLGCAKLTSLDVSSFDTSNVTNMNSMFYSCSGLQSLDLSNFDTSKVTSMSQIFYECRSLKNLNISTFDTSNISDMNAMFYNCQSLENLDLSSFNTSNVTGTSGMFYNCQSLQSLDIRNFDMSNVTSTGNMFANVSSNVKIIVKNEADKQAYLGINYNTLNDSNFTVLS